MTHAATVGAGSGVFVGRRLELGLVATALDAARARIPTIVAIEGGPGIGKTAFLRRCVAGIEDEVVVRASGDESEVTLDYGVLAQLLSRASAISGWTPQGDGLSGRSPVSPFAAGADLLSMVGSLEDLGTVVLTVDDAQWIDAASARALLFALRRLRGDRVCVLIASRPLGHDADRSSWCRFLSDGERVQHLKLTGLDTREVTQLARSLDHPPLTHAAAERLREHTEGHPLYLRALLAELPPDALAFEQGPLPAPHSFAATVLTRLAQLGGETQDLVAAAAVAGPRCSARLAGATCELSDPFEALDEAVAAGFLVLLPGPIPAELSFPHPLLQAAVYDDLSPTRRRALHLALARLTSGPVSLRHRVAASPGADDGLAAELEKTGEAEIAEGRLTAGIEHLLLASRIADSSRVRDAALLRAVECLGVAGDVPRAHALFEQVLACSDSPRRSFVLGALTASAGRLPEAIAALRALTERLDFPAHPELYGPVSSSLAIINAYAADGAEAVAWARRALATEQGEITVDVTAKQALAIGHGLSGHPADGIAVLDSLSVSRLAPEPFEEELMATRGNLKAWCGDLLGAVEDLSAVIRWSRHGAAPRSLANAYSSLADAEYRLGRWEEATPHAELAVSLAEDSDQVWELPFANAVASYLHAGMGNWSIAAQHVEAAERATERAPLPVSICYASLARANLAAVQGDWSGALAALRILSHAGLNPVAAAVGSRTWELEAEALLRTGSLEEAERLLGEHGPELRGSAAQLAGVERWRLRGMLEYARGNPSGAREAFLQGQTCARSAGSPLAEGALELAHGHFLRKTGRRGAAAARLNVARGRFESLRARPLVDQCEAELSACGVRARTAASDDQGLSAREQVVAHLVAAGKSNREVGEELYLTTKAVEYHLGNIFTKLGIRSRHQLASRLSGRGRPPEPDAVAAR